MQACQQLGGVTALGLPEMVYPVVMFLLLQCVRAQMACMIRLDRLYCPGDLLCTWDISVL